MSRFHELLFEALSHPDLKPLFDLGEIGQYRVDFEKWRWEIQREKKNYQHDLQVTDEMPLKKIVNE